MHVCGSASKSVCVCVCVRARASSTGRAVCEEGIPTQSWAAGACSYSPSFDPHSQETRTPRACSQTLPAECWLRIVEVQVKAKPLNAAPGQPRSRASLGQPPRNDLGRRAGLGPRRAGPGFPACPFNPAARREHVSGAPGGIGRRRRGGSCIPNTASGPRPGALARRSAWPPSSSYFSSSAAPSPSSAHG